MKLKIRQVGNSLAVTIPKEYASKLNLSDKSVIDAELEDKKIVIMPAKSKWDELQERLKSAAREKGITEMSIDKAIEEIRYGKR